MKYYSTIMDILLLSKRYHRFFDFEPMESFKQTGCYKEYIYTLDKPNAEKFKSFFYELAMFNEEIYIDNLTFMLFFGMKLGMETEKMLNLLDK